MVQLKLVKGERIDPPMHSQPVNCKGCHWKVGKVCSYHHALLQSNGNRPTDCEFWEAKGVVTGEH